MQNLNMDTIKRTAYTYAGVCFDYYQRTIYPKSQSLDQSHIFLISTAIAFALHSFQLLGSVMSSLVCFFYPLEKTRQALITNDSHKIQECLVYWCLFSAVLIIEQMFGWLFAFIPFFQLIKTGFLMWFFNMAGFQVTTDYLMKKLSMMIQYKIENNVNNFVAPIVSAYADQVVRNVDQVVRNAEPQNPGIESVRALPPLPPLPERAGAVVSDIVKSTRDEMIVGN